jgi:hypothetical protein
MILLATDLNGHLRVHPKRVAFMPHPDSVPPKESPLVAEMLELASKNGSGYQQKQRVCLQK